MKIKVQTSVIYAALSKVAGIAPSRSTMPILQNVKLSAQGDAMTITASDTEINATITIPATVEQKGATTIPAAAFLDICKKAKSDDVALTVTGDKATIASGRSRFTLGALDTEDYPIDMSVSTDVQGMTMKASELLSIIDKTLTSVSQDEHRHYLNGLYLHTDEGTLHAVATDGNRMTHITLPDMCAVSPVITPRKMLTQLTKMFDGAEDVTIRTDENKVEISSERLTVVSKVIDGQFPDYQRIIPRTFETSFTVGAIAFREAIDRVAVARDERTGAVRVELTAGMLTVKARSNGDEAVDEIDAEYVGDGYEFGVNSLYLTDALRAAGDCSVTFHMNSPRDAIRMVADGQDGVEWVIMPMRI